MSLYNYVSACSGFLEELRVSITREESDVLNQDLSKMGRREWYAWLSRNSAEIASFVEATPSARLSKKKWKDQTLRLRLVLAAYQHVYQARIVLRAIAENPLEPGGSYRTMSSIAGEVYNKMFLDDEVPDWPFDSESPFS